ncbi:unnamed protein product [Hymenolepis diminuta]|uniref:Uncharacterized protein n=1 Tax=Hymenolepis diminuta TaxID=6216 RepID=A0A564Z4N8_HYMDI|nr:unnamed protein product [Hymenolepis diminuta]
MLLSRLYVVLMTLSKIQNFFRRDDFIRSLNEGNARKNTICENKSYSVQTSLTEPLRSSNTILTVIC